MEKVNGQNVDVSVILITYNQEKFIRDALDSILMQDTDLNLEILVGEDCSPDGTSCILKKYEQRYKERLEVIYNINNVGASRNLYNLLSRAKGKYIAMLEGDDYWLNEKRLQMLYDFLESNQDCAGVSHVRERRTFEGKLTGHDPRKDVIGKKITLNQFHEGFEFSIMGCMYRNVFVQNSKIYEAAITATRNACDSVITHIVLNEGPVFVLNECLGVYRVSGAETSYCATTRQEKVDMDAILQLRGIVNLYGNDIYYKRKISEKAFDGIMFLLKRKMLSEMYQFWKNLSTGEKVNLIRYFPRHMYERIMLHIK